MAKGMDELMNVLKQLANSVMWMGEKLTHKKVE